MEDAEPYVLADLNNDLREQIEAKVQKAAEKPVGISSEQWNDLHSILTAYTKSHNEWLGYLDRRETAALADVAKKATKLYEALEKVQGMELSWIIDDMLQRGSTKLLADELTQLANINYRSPRIREKNEEGDVVPPVTRRPSPAALHGKMKAWWLPLAGCGSATIKDTIIDEKRTPFSHFLEYAYSILPEEISPGWSATTVKEYGRELRRSAQLMDDFAEKLAKLDGSS